MNERPRQQVPRGGWARRQGLALHPAAPAAACCREDDGQVPAPRQAVRERQRLALLAAPGRRPLAFLRLA